MTAYLATFDRIGRHHDIPPLNVSGDADTIAEQVYRYARGHLGSREVEVLIDLEKLTGTIFVGGVRNGGTLALAEVTGAPGLPPRPTDAVPQRPNPGSDEALSQGCTCAVLDNNHGRSAPWPPDGWWITEGCPVHAPARAEGIA